MKRAQYLALLAAIAVFLTLYLGFSTIPPAQKMTERSRALKGESTSFQALLGDAKAHLTGGAAEALLALEQKENAATADSSRINALKALSAWWYDQGKPLVAGGYAEQVAELEQSDAAWSVAGATFYHALSGEQDPTLRAYAGTHAVKAFESAISLAPEQVEHRVNLALVYAENPPPDKPMQAVLMLRELESKHPDNAAVYNALGRLAIKTNQWTRAVERLEKAWALDNTNPNTPCLLAKAYEGAGQTDKAVVFAKRCQSGQ